MLFSERQYSAKQCSEALVELHSAVSIVVIVNYRHPMALLTHPGITDIIADTLSRGTAVHLSLLHYLEVQQYTYLCYTI